MAGKRGFRAEWGYLQLRLDAMLYFWLHLATIEISETQHNYNDLQKFTEEKRTAEYFSYLRICNICQINHRFLGPQYHLTLNFIHAHTHTKEHSFSTKKPLQAPPEQFNIL